MEVDLLIGGVCRPASNDATFERRNPISGEVVTRAAAATPLDAAAAAEAAAAAFTNWAQTGPSARRQILMKAADAIGQRSQDLLSSMVGETGATPAWATFNAKLAVGILHEAAAMTTQVSGEVIPSDEAGCLAFSVREPAGVVLGIAPWNAPIILGVRAMALPLACGNTVVLKSSEICPATHHLLGKILQDAGVPPGVVNVISTSPEGAASAVESLVAHPAVRRINFTGSTRVGRVVAELAGRHLKPVLLELGGKAPLVILDDADIDQAVHAAAFGAFMHQGQICMSTERIIVEEKVADIFLDRFAHKTASLKVGDPTDSAVDIGSLVGLESAARLSELVRDAVGKGAAVVSGGNPEGTIMPPTILDRVTPDMRIYHEESFGPVVSMLRARNDDEAVSIANDTEYGLVASVFSRDVSRALTVARRLQSGMCHINGPTVHDEAQMPFGGLKASGYGRFGGRVGIEEFTELRWMTIHTAPSHYPF